jgi:oligoribonuclease NrnB/cAMP/cGMP phosphodiesterase (DHH superfamily)
MGYFTLEQLRNIKTVISHGNHCPDGVASAMIVRDAYNWNWSDIEIRVVDHQSEEKAKLEAKPGMMFVDFSPDPERAQEFIDVGAICLDHHKKGSSVQAFVAAGLGVFGDEDKDPGVCGAWLAYEHVWKPLRHSAELPVISIEPQIVEEFARLSGIRDTWQTKDPDWVKACIQAEALRFWPLERLLQSCPAGWREYWEVGPVLWDRKTKTVAKVSERVFRWDSPKGTRCAFFQGVSLSSDVAEAIGATTDLIVAYDIAYEDGQLKLICSSRSRGSYDCGSLALAHGGGGHTRAAGFNVPMTIDSPNPYRMLQDTIAAHESKT